MRRLIFSTVAAGALIAGLGPVTVQAVGPPTEPPGNIERACPAFFDVVNEHVEAPLGTPASEELTELFGKVGAYCPD